MSEKKITIDPRIDLAIKRQSYLDQRGGQEHEVFPQHRYTAKKGKYYLEHLRLEWENDTQHKRHTEGGYDIFQDFLERDRRTA